MNYTERFSTHGGSYATAMSKSPAVRTTEFQALFADIPVPPNSLVLDIPAAGQYLKQYLPPTSVIIPTDFVAISKSSVLVPEPGVAPMRLQKCDVCVCLAALHHIKDDQVLFRELYEALVPGGLVYLADPQVNTPTAEFLETVIPQHNGIYRDFFQLEYPGFTVLRAGTKTCPWVFESPQHAIEFCSELFGLELDDPVLKPAMQKLGFVDNKLAWELGYAVLRKDVL
jgi:SAM-dependent methyltransferase